MNTINKVVNYGQSVSVARRNCLENHGKKNVISNYPSMQDSINLSKRQNKASFKGLPSVSYEEVQSWSKTYLQKHKPNIFKRIFSGNKYEKIVNDVLNCDSVKNDATCRSLIYWLYSKNETLLDNDVFSDCKISEIISKQIKKYVPEAREKHVQDYIDFFDILQNNNKLREIATQKDKEQNIYPLAKALENWDADCLNKKIKELLEVPLLFEVETNKDAMKDLLINECSPRKFNKSGISDEKLMTDLLDYKKYYSVFDYKYPNAMEPKCSSIKRNCENSPNYKYLFHLLMTDYNSILRNDSSLVKELPYSTLYNNISGISDADKFQHDIKEFLNILTSSNKLIAIATDTKKSSAKGHASPLTSFLENNLDKLNIVSADLKKLTKHQRILHDPKYELHIKSIFNQETEAHQVLYNELMYKLDRLEKNN